MNIPDALSPAEAAKRARVSRATIVRALKAGEIQAFRDNSGRWNISPEALEEWRSRRASRTVHPRRMNTNHAQEIAHLRAELDTARQTASEQAKRIARLEAEATAAAARLDDAKADRDAWRSQAVTLAQRHEATSPEGGFSLLRLIKRISLRPADQGRKP